MVRCFVIGSYEAQHIFICGYCAEVMTHSCMCWMFPKLLSVIDLYVVEHIPSGYYEVHTRFYKSSIY